MHVAQGLISILQLRVPTISAENRMNLINRQLLPSSMLAAAAMLLGTAWVSDDAFITLRVIDNFVNGYGLRYNVIERVQAFTHPLWLFFLTPFYALTREALVTTMLISVCVSLGALWLLATRVANSIEYGCLLVLAAMASQAIYQFSTSGLEGPLTFFLLALFAWQLPRTKRTWIPAGIAGMLLLNRLDLAVLISPAVIYLLLRTHGKDRIRVAIAALLPILAWTIFSLVYYGAPFPNTAYAKLGTGFNTGALILRGLEYTKDFVLVDPLLALIIGKAIVEAVRSGKWPVTLQVIGIVLYLAYIVVIGGDFMSGRFFAPPGFVALCVLAQLPAPQWLTKRAITAAYIAIGMLGILLVARVTEQPNFIIRENGDFDTKNFSNNGIIDERRFYYPFNGFIPVLKGWAEPGSEPVHPLRQDGLAMKTESQRIAMPIAAVGDNAGMRGFYAGPDVHCIDIHALTDAFLARMPALPEARVGHYKRPLPSGYGETVLNAAPTTSLEILRPLLNDVTLATRAPLLADERWNAIWRLLSGQHHWVYEVDPLQFAS